VQNAIAKRKITQLLHFTRLENLESILTHGLLSRRDVEQAAIGIPNDAYRHDGHTDANCLSVTFPNYKMLYRLRCENKDSRWVIVGVHPSVLWTKRCAFCVENASNGNVSSIPIAQREGVAAFEKMFDPWPGKPSRAELGLTDALPTNPQAEVLCFDRIETNLIIGVATAFPHLAQSLTHQHPHFKFTSLSGLFAPRIDWKHWRSSA
jgi:hypothetical protein